jgi:hypothetical protein
MKHASSVAEVYRSRKTKKKNSLTLKLFSAYLGTFGHIVGTLLLAAISSPLLLVFLLITKKKKKRGKKLLK